ncbi:MAG TPA: hypothetical protein VF064_15530 [Pyrinomonadaceae bacterium]
MPVPTRPARRAPFRLHRERRPTEAEGFGGFALTKYDGTTAAVRPEAINHRDTEAQL